MLFSEYMDEWLYGEEGYYKHFKSIGKSGTFMFKLKEIKEKI